MKVVAIAGSPRPAGNTNYLVDVTLQELASHGLETERIMLSDFQVNPCLGHEDCASFSACKQQDDLPSIMEKFVNAEGVILSSPVYYDNVSAQMKAFIDRNFFRYTHNIAPKAICAGLIVICGGGSTENTVNALKRFLEYSADIPDDEIITLTGESDRPDSARNNPTLIGEAHLMGKRMADILAAHS
jgi:multimeric flavodoxin WrbA